MRDAGFPLLTFIIFTPLVGAVLVAVLPRRRPEIVRAVGYVATAAELGFVDEVIYPRTLRAHLHRSLELLKDKRDSNPPKKHTNIPL